MEDILIFLLGFLSGIVVMGSTAIIVADRSADHNRKLVDKHFQEITKIYFEAQNRVAIERINEISKIHDMYQGRGRE